MTDLKISVVICTYNRADYLGAAIDSLLQQDFQGFEVIVVDNASTDSTRLVVEERQSDGRLRYAYEKNQGLNYARNLGVLESKADLVAYLDDDAIAPPQWLSHIYNIYQTDDKVGAAGGKIVLDYPDNISPPAWLSDILAESLGAYDLGLELKYIERPGLTPRGLNYSLKKEIWKSVGGFDVGLDRSGKNLLSNGDLFMTQKIMEAGWKVAYLPEAVVSHCVLPDRINRQWFVKRAWWQGVSEYYRELLLGQAQTGPQLYRGSERLLRGLVKSVKYFDKPNLSFENLLYAYCQVGYLLTAIKRPKLENLNG